MIQPVLQPGISSLAEAVMSSTWSRNPYGHAGRPTQSTGPPRNDLAPRNEESRPCYSAQEVAPSRWARQLLTARGRPDRLTRELRYLADHVIVGGAANPHLHFLAGITAVVKAFSSNQSAT